MDLHFLCSDDPLMCSIPKCGDPHTGHQALFNRVCISPSLPCHRHFGDALEKELPPSWSGTYDHNDHTQ